jgi:predicted nucleic acid-binding protein
VVFSYSAHGGGGGLEDADAAQLAAAREAAGRPVDLRDTWIAGIVAARGATLITRNLRHFRDLDVRVVDPWA